MDSFGNQNGSDLETKVSNMQKQIEFMDEFLGITVPEYSQLKNLVTGTQRARTSAGNSVLPIQIVLGGQGGAPQQFHPPNFPPYPIVVYLPQPEVATPQSPAPPMTTTTGTLANNCCQAPPGGMIKSRQKKSTSHEVGSAILNKSPKRRGRKRKVSMLTSSAASAANPSLMTSTCTPVLVPKIARRQIETSPIVSYACAVEEKTASLPLSFSSTVPEMVRESQDVNWRMNGQTFSIIKRDIAPTEQEICPLKLFADVVLANHFQSDEGFSKVKKELQ